MSIDRLVILQKIGDHLQGVLQWSKPCNGADWMQTAYLDMVKAEALVELLEVADCGFRGGFDRGQPQTYNLFERWDWLFRKHHNPTGMRFGCGCASYEDLQAFFKQEASSITHAPKGAGLGLVLQNAFSQPLTRERVDFIQPNS